MTGVLEGFEKICKYSDIKENGGKRFYINDTDIAVFKSENKIFALNNVCPHQHTAHMYEGFIEDCNVVCPAHGWEFNLATGKMPDGRRGLRSFEIQIIDGFVFVKVIKKEFNW
ncbi:assimilatory nitrite reductase [NAD(P)H] small subunit [bacterium BMS3Abin04]|nr:assimilatory nitrite reductase [NAD(P)H] small subunit [bacterium BMS3Abin04]